MNTISDQINNIRLLSEQIHNHESVRDRENTRLKSFNRIIVKANESNNQKDVVQGILDACIEFVSFDIGGIYLVKNGSASIVATRFLPADSITTLDSICTKRPELEDLFLFGKPVIVQDYDLKHPDTSKLLGGISTLISVPILFNNHVKGCVNIGSFSPREISSDECDVLRTLGKHLGHVLHRFEIEQELELKLIEVEAYTQELQATLDELRYNSKIIEDKKNEYQVMFDYNPTATWIKDFSKIKTYIDAYKYNNPNATVDIFHNFLLNNPHEVNLLLSLSKIIKTNKSALSLYGVSSQEEFCKYTNKIFKDSSISVFIDALLAIFLNQSEFSQNDINYTVDGEIIYVIFRWVVEPGHEHLYDRLLVSNIDITRQKLLELELESTVNILEQHVTDLKTANDDTKYYIKQMECVQQQLDLERQNFKDLFNKMSDMVFILSFDDTILSINNAVRSRLGYPNGELIGKSFSIVSNNSHLMSQLSVNDNKKCNMSLISKSKESITVDSRLVTGQWNGQDVIFNVSREVEV